MEYREISLTLPANGEYALIARLAVSGLGMLSGLEVGLIDDLRSAVDESCDCLTHQPAAAARLTVRAGLDGARLNCRIEAERTGAPGAQTPLDLDVTRGILETLMPDVRLEADERGVYAVAFSLPVSEGV